MLNTSNGIEKSTRKREKSKTKKSVDWVIDCPEHFSNWSQKEHTLHFKCMLFSSFVYQTTVLRVLERVSQRTAVFAVCFSFSKWAHVYFGDHIHVVHRPIQTLNEEQKEESNKKSLIHSLHLFCWFKNWIQAVSMIFIACVRVSGWSRQLFSSFLISLSSCCIVALDVAIFLFRGISMAIYTHSCEGQLKNR